ncbi:MAG TPA: cobalamin B12-binding domain-containing protein [Clostridiales bacterium]|nr:cobalamin B12-binding domain-containing protein [Clostridiales bacterium]
MDKLVLGGAIGNCVHVAGVYAYMQLAESVGYKTKFLGAAVPPRELVDAIEKYDPYIVCISYRLTPNALYNILEDFFSMIEEQGLYGDRLFYFGGTPECIAVAKQFEQFSYFFQGEEHPEYILKSLHVYEEGSNASCIQSQISLEGDQADLRSIKEGNYRPLIRHHFGLPSLEETIEGIKKIALSEEVDVISLAPDQNAQQYFFEPEKMDKRLDGTGGVPIRTRDDLEKIYAATQCGNYPRLRIYAGTRNLLKWAKLSVETINNAWGTIPLFWYSEMDGRSERTLEEAIEENREVIRWYAERNIPVEINESHQWSLRECSDVMAVVDFYIAAYNAKKLGVNKYIAQFMFNTPRLTSGKADLAKMLAKKQLLDELEDENFVYLTQVRAGLTHFSIDMDVAKGQLAASTLLALALKPHIIHVVSFTEADHAATPDDVIESCKIVRGVLKNAWRDFPDMTRDPEVIKRKNYLLSEAREVICNIEQYFKDIYEDPLANPDCLASMVKLGLLDAPHLRGNPAALGKVRTMPLNGGYECIDANGNVLKDSERTKNILENIDRRKLI